MQLQLYCGVYPDKLSTTSAPELCMPDTAIEATVDEITPRPTDVELKNLSIDDIFSSASNALMPATTVKKSLNHVNEMEQNNGCVDRNRLKREIKDCFSFPQLMKCFADMQRNNQVLNPLKVTSQLQTLRDNYKKLTKRKNNSKVGEKQLRKAKALLIGAAAVNSKAIKPIECSVTDSTPFPRIQESDIISSYSYKSLFEEAAALENREPLGINGFNVKLKRKTRNRIIELLRSANGIGSIACNFASIMNKFLSKYPAAVMKMDSIQNVVATPQNLSPSLKRRLSDKQAKVTKKRRKH